MKVAVAFGQGNGYGDGKVYVCKLNEMDWYTENRVTATFVENGVDVTNDAIEAFKYGSYSEYSSMSQFLDSVDLNKKTLFYSQNMKRR